MTEDEDLAYVVPTEGSLLWQDTLAIPMGAPHPMNAHAFINFVLDAEEGKHIAETIQYATANKAAKDLMPEDYRNNPVIFPLGRDHRQVRTRPLSRRRGHQGPRRDLDQGSRGLSHNASRRAAGSSAARFSFPD